MAPLMNLDNAGQSANALGLRLPAPPAGAFTIPTCWNLWLLLKFFRDVTTGRMRPPRQALPSFRVEMVLCSGPMT